jgi:hypothetical protein
MGAMGATGAMGAMGALGALGAGRVSVVATLVLSVSEPDEYAGNVKSKRLSLSPAVNAIFAVSFKGSAERSRRASKKAPFFASTSGVDASSRVVPVFGSNASLVTTRPRTFRAFAMPSGLEKSS